MKIQWAKRLFSKGQKDHEVARKAVTEISKMAHVRLDLNKVTSDNILPLVR
jgi:seryl-tRNA synthetase